VFHEWNSGTHEFRLLFLTYSFSKILL
jgi:hypothetical protein